jgi:hypothetical protein
MSGEGSLYLFKLEFIHALRSGFEIFYFSNCEKSNIKMHGILVID